MLIFYGTSTARLRVTSTSTARLRLTSKVQVTRSSLTVKAMVIIVVKIQKKELAQMSFHGRRMNIGNQNQGLNCDQVRYSLRGMRNQVRIAGYVQHSPDLRRYTNNRHFNLICEIYRHTTAFSFSHVLRTTTDMTVSCSREISTLPPSSPRCNRGQKHQNICVYVFFIWWYSFDL